jgi:hypothetical protein
LARAVEDNLDSVTVESEPRDVEIEHRVMGWTCDEHIVLSVEPLVWTSSWSDMVNLGIIYGRLKLDSPVANLTVVSVKLLEFPRRRRVTYYSSSVD